jgi:hypothetical protein
MVIAIAVIAFLIMFAGITVVGIFVLRARQPVTAGPGDAQSLSSTPQTSAMPPRGTSASTSSILEKRK